MFGRQEGHWRWFCGTPYLPFDLVPSCEGPAGEITSATLKLGQMTNGWRHVVPMSMIWTNSWAPGGTATTQPCQQRGHLYSPQVWLGHSHPRSQRGVGRRSPEDRGCKSQEKAAKETGNPFPVINNWLIGDYCKQRSVLTHLSSVKTRVLCYVKCPDMSPVELSQR